MPTPAAVPIIWTGIFSTSCKATFSLKEIRNTEISCHDRNYIFLTSTLKLTEVSERRFSRASGLEWENDKSEMVEMVNNYFEIFTSSAD